MLTIMYDAYYGHVSSTVHLLTFPLQIPYLSTVSSLVDGNIGMAFKTTSLDFLSILED